MFLLARQPFKNLQELGRRGVQSVVKFCFMDFGAGFPSKGFLAEIGDLAMHIQIQSLEVLELRRQVEHLGAPSRAHLKGQRAGILVQLPDFIRRGIGIFPYRNLD